MTSSLAPASRTEADEVVVVLCGSHVSEAERWKAALEATLPHCPVRVVSAPGVGLVAGMGIGTSVAGRARVVHVGPRAATGVGQILDNLVALDRVLDRTDAVRDRSRAEETRLNAWLRGHPGDRDRVVAVAEELRLVRIDWSRVNEGLARDLAVCYLFPPALDTSGLVAAKRLRERGVVTDVIRHDLGSLRAIDEMSLQVAGPTLGRLHTMPGKASFEGWKHLAEFAAEAWRTMQAWEAEQGEYASVYSRAMVPASHYAAALMKVRRPGLRWVAEFSDPMDINSVGGERPNRVVEDWLSAELRAALQARGHLVEPEPRLFEWSERVAYALADEVVFTNVNQRRMMLEHCSDRGLAKRAAEISRVSAHPTPPRAAYELAPLPAGAFQRVPGVVQLGYFGAFYSTRDLGDVASALLTLSQRERDRVRLHVFTSEPDQLAIRLAGLGLSGTIRAHAFRPFHEFLALTRALDVLVVDDAHTRAYHPVNPYLPSKLADYRGSGTPIWAISEPGSILSQLDDLDHVSTLGDVGSAVRVLRTLIGQHAVVSR